MRYSVFILFAFLASAIATSEDTANEIIDGLSHMFKIPDKAIENCVRKSGLLTPSLPPIDKIYEEIFDETDRKQREIEKKMYCAIACCAQVQGLMNGKNLNMTAIDNLIKESHSPAAQKLTLTAVANQCAAMVTEAANECETVARFTACMVFVMNHM